MLKTKLPSTTKIQISVRRTLIGIFTVSTLFTLPLTAKALDKGECNKELNPKAQLCGECKFGPFNGQRDGSGLFCIPC